MQAFEELEEKRIKEVDALSHNLARYIGIAVNNPKQFPRKPSLTKSEAPYRIMTSEEMEKIAKISTIKLGGKVDGN